MDKDWKGWIDASKPDVGFKKNWKGTLPPSLPQKNFEILLSNNAIKMSKQKTR